MIAGETMVSIYRNIYDKTSRHTLSISSALERIRSGKSRDLVISIRNEQDRDRKNNLKSGLPSVCFSGTFSERYDDKLIEHSGFVCMDLDDVNVSETIEGFRSWEYSYAVWISPSGSGVKVLLRIADKNKHREHYLALKKEFPNIDHKCINPSRVCYESYDPDIYINVNSKIYSTCLKQEIVEDLKISDDILDIYRKLITWTESSKKTDKTFHEGNRNYFAYILSGALCRHGVSRDDANRLISNDYSSQGFGEGEISRCVKNAYKANGGNFGTVGFSDKKLIVRETKYEVDPKIFDDGYKPDGIVYGSDVYEKAVDIYTNGYKSAETTGVLMLDEYFKWKRGELTLISGIGNYGKSSYLRQMMIIKSLISGIKWGIFAPEDAPAEEYYIELAESLIGARCDDASRFIPREAFNRAYEFAANHFFFIESDTISPSPEYIKTKFLELILKEKIGGCVIDPFNQMTNDYGRAGGRSDKYLETFLSDCSRFAKSNDVIFTIVAHPHKLQKNGALDYPCPDVYEIADGAMWNNKCDNILIYHRPFGQSDPNNPLCEHYSKKIRRQKMVGKKGSFEFEFNRKRRRFYFGGASPLDGNEYEYPPIQKITPNKLIEIPLSSDDPF